MSVADIDKQLKEALLAPGNDDSLSHHSIQSESAQQGDDLLKQDDEHFIEVHREYDGNPEEALPEDEAIKKKQESCFQEVAKVIHTNPKKAMALLVNFARDVLWSYLANETYDIQFNKNDDFGSQTISQFIWTMTLMTPCLILFKLFCQRNQIDIDWKTSIFSMFAAGTSVFTWNSGQLLGVFIGKNFLDLHEIAANFFASLFTGTFEGLTQVSVAKLEALFSSSFWSRETFNFQNFKGLMKDLFLAVIPGMTPGSMWQVTYTLCKGVLSLPATATSLLVASVVCACNCIDDALKTKVAKLLFGSEEHYRGSFDAVATPPIDTASP